MRCIRGVRYIVEIAALAASVLLVGSLMGAPAIADDSCIYAKDHTCHEGLPGSLSCKPGTDDSDCRGNLDNGNQQQAGNPRMLPAPGGVCIYANNGVCHDPTMGGANAGEICPPATDWADCGGAPPQPRPDEGGNLGFLPAPGGVCIFAGDGVCHDPTMGGAPGGAVCPATTDWADCGGVPPAPDPPLPAAEQDPFGTWILKTGQWAGGVNGQVNRNDREEAGRLTISRDGTWILREQGRVEQGTWVELGRGVISLIEYDAGRDAAVSFHDGYLDVVTDIGLRWTSYDRV
jgi:hypothetical protein